MQHLIIADKVGCIYTSTERSPFVMKDVGVFISDCQCHMCLPRPLILLTSSYWFNLIYLLQWSLYTAKASVPKDFAIRNELLL